MLLPKKKLIRLCSASIVIFFIVRMLRSVEIVSKQKTKKIQNFEINTSTAEDEILFQYLYDYIEEYRIISILDVPCSISTPWMLKLLRNLSIEFNHKFSYHGVEFDNSNLHLYRETYKAYANEWKFSAIDYTKDPLPNNYEVILFYETFEYLSMSETINALEIVSKTTGSKYLLTTTFNDTLNRNSENTNREFIQIDLNKPPYSLNKPVKVFRVGEKRFLNLYEIQQYLKKIDFKIFRNNTAKWLYERHHPNEKKGNKKPGIAKIKANTNSKNTKSVTKKDKTKKN